MKENKYFLNTALAVILGLALAAAVVVRTVAPAVIIPAPDGIALVLVSLTALVADHYLAPGAKRCWICIPVFAALTFGVLPMVAMLVRVEDALSLMISGTAPSRCWRSSWRSLIWEAASSMWRWSMNSTAPSGRIC